jgi:hypothetical protein
MTQRPGNPERCGGGGLLLFGPANPAILPEPIPGFDMNLTIQWLLV